MTSTMPPGQPPRLVRAGSGRILAGVAKGLADHLGVDVILVRAAFVLLTLAGGAGVAMYAAFWVLAPIEAPIEAPIGRETNGSRAAPDSPRGLGFGIAVLALALTGLVLIQLVGQTLSPGLVWPLAVAGAGVVLLWSQADDVQRARWRAATGTGRVAGVVRTALGVLLVVGGGAAVLTRERGFGDAAQVGLAALVVVSGLALVSGPWWLQMARDLTAERAARIREQERAEIAAHVHDSVLHTLALIQRSAGDPREVGRLARAQERELRSWLYRPKPAQDATLRQALETAAAEVEDDHRATVEVIVVGDCPLDESAAALLQATREALVNAAKYAGEAAVSLYAEVEPERVVVYVRDRGPGFDLATVPTDRLGVRQSIIGRMERNGGRAVLRSAAGQGTEVTLELPRRGVGKP